MASNSNHPNGPESKLIRYTLIEPKDPTDTLLETCFLAIQQNRSMMDSNTLLQITGSNKKNQEHVSLGLLYGVLTDSTNSNKYFQDLLLLNGTNLSSIINVLDVFIVGNWRRLIESVREGLLWFLRKTLAANIDHIDRLYYVFLRQINPHQFSMEYCDAILNILHVTPTFLNTYPEMKLLTIYTFLAIFPLYLRQNRSARSIELILSLTRDHLHTIGRDGIRLLLQMGHLSEIDHFLKHLASTSTADYLPKIFSVQTEPKYLAMPLPFELEKNLKFLLDKCRMNSQEKYYFEWFQTEYLNFKQHAESISLCSHIIRYVCLVCPNHPNPTRVTRWAFISWLFNLLLTYQQTLQQTLISASQGAMNAAALIAASSPPLIQVNEQIVQCRLALYYDWFFYENHFPLINANEIDAQLNSALVGYHLLSPSYYNAKQMLLFLLFTSENLIVSYRPSMQKNITRLFAELFQRIPIINPPKLTQMLNNDRELIQRLHAAFFIVSTVSTAPSTTVLQIHDEVIPINDDTSPNAAMPPTLVIDEESEELMHIHPITSSNPARFSDDEDDEQYDPQLNRKKIFDPDDNDQEVLLITDENKTSTDLYNISLLRAQFPFERFRSEIHERTQTLAMSYSTASQSTKNSIITQIFEHIASTLSDKRPLVLPQPIDPAGPISSFSMSKFDRHTEKFQSRLLAIFDEQTIIHALLCLWLLRETLNNRFLPLNRSSNGDGTETVNLKDLSPQKLHRSLKQSPICILFRLIKDDRTNQDVYIKLLQAMYFFQPELASFFLCYLSIDVPDTKIAGELFEKFAVDIIKLSTSHRKVAIPPAKMPTFDQDFVDFLHEVLSLCEQDDTETFLYLFSYAYRLYPKRLLNMIKFVRLLLQTINQTELEQFMCEILKHRLQLFHAQKLYWIVDQTLLFSQHEQEYFWQLLATHDFVQNDYEQLFTNIIEHLLNQSKSVIGEQRLAKSNHFNTYKNTIALANVYDILRTKSPTYGLVCCLFAHEITKDFSEKLCLLWHEQHHDLFWRHLERILQKWIQREIDPTKTKVDYKIGAIKMAHEHGLKYILQHLQILLEHPPKTNSKTNDENLDQDDLNDQLTIDDTPMIIPLSKSTIKSLVDFIHQDEQLYQQTKTFVDRFENGTSLVPAGSSTHGSATTSMSTATSHSQPSHKRRKVDNKS